MFLSRLHPRKRLFELIQAYALAQSKGHMLPPLDVYGPDEGELERCQDLVAQRDLTNVVHFRGPLDYGDVRRAMAAHAIFVLPSVDEPFPNVLLEALATGMTVVCTSESGVAPYIAAADAGLVCAPDVESMSETLIAVSTDASQSLGDMRLRALTLAKSTFSMEVVASTLERAYRDACQDGS